MKTIDIKGKPYTEVNERLIEFRSNKKYDGYTLETNIVQFDNGVCTMKAVIKDANDRIVATGYAQEKENSSFINKTSYIENCETSAWGRALGNLGIGINTSVASADEVLNAINNQPKQQPKPQAVKKEQKEPEQIIDADIDIISEINSFNDKTSLTKYYNEHKAKVQNKIKFGQAYTARIKEIERKQAQ